MRRDVTRGMSAVLLLAAGAGCGRNAQPSAATETAKTVTVTIDIRCVAPDSTYIQVSPWEAKLKKNNKDELEFIVASTSNTDSVFVELKSDTASWPTDDPPPYKLNKGENGKKKLKGAQPNGEKSYPYNIRAYCTDGPNVYRRLLIDPDIFVD